MPLWARTVYDFLLAYRLRTVPRADLLDPALTPLYQAWVASHLRAVRSGRLCRLQPNSLVEELRAALSKADKPYLIARWRWPDRFNP